MSNSGNKELSSSQMKGSHAGGRDYTMAPGSTIELKQPVVDFADMKTEIRDHCFQIAEEAFRASLKGEKKYFKNMAEMIKENQDEKFNGSWHVCVGKFHFILTKLGKEFGSFVTYESHTIILFWINHIGFLIWKFG